MKTIVTNNILVKERFEDKFNVIYIEDNHSYKPVLLKIRDLVHTGYKVLTHPLSGSVKPNETPYKSVIIEKGKTLDEDSVKIIELSIATLDKFQNMERTPNWTERVLDDFRVVDLDLMVCTIERLGHF